MAWPGFGNFRFDSIMGGQDDLKKRFTSGTVPEQRDVVAQPFEQPQAPEPPEIQSRAYGPEARQSFQSPMSLPGGLAEDRRTEGEKYYEELERLRNNRGPALTAYQKALEEQPTWEQHKPDWKRRLAGALISGAVAADGEDSGKAVALGRSVIRAPYDTARSEYANRMKNLGASAKLELDEIEGQLKSLQAAKALGLDYDKFQETRLQNEHARLISEGTLGVAQGNLRVNQFEANTRAGTAEEQARHWQNQDVNAAHTGGVQERNVNSQIADRVEQQKIARERIQAGLQAALIRAGANRENLPSPAEQQTAIDNGVRQLALDPRFRDLIDMETDPKIPQLKPDDNSPRYQAAMRALIEITKRQLEQGTPFGDAPTIGTIPVRPGGGGGASW